ncbi:MAG: hypothetical protein U9N30_01280 [Campylobacterota bacterium]|nr:hypothetical protein [Campylobacterota bacterium]
MKNIYFVLILLCVGTFAHATQYEDTIKNWETPQDVAQWMKSDWRFDMGIAQSIVHKIKTQGASASVAKSAQETYQSPKGWCKDAANFAKETLNNMDEKYDAGYIFIRNKKGPPHHWVTGFNYQGKLFVMDYGAGKEWADMMGLHGPYDSLDDYSEFLSTIHHRNFKLDYVMWNTPRSSANNQSNELEPSLRTRNILTKFDKNSDDMISKSEAPKRMKSNFDRLDTDGSELLDVSELNQLAPL